MFARMKGETVPFRAYGKEYRIPRDLPADVVLRLARCEGEIPAPLIFEAAARVFGEEALAELCAHDDFTLPRLEAMLEWAFDVCCGSAAAAGEDTGKN